VQYGRVYVMGFNLALKISVVEQLAWTPGAFHFLWRELSSKGTVMQWNMYHTVSDVMHAMPSALIPEVSAVLRGSIGDRSSEAGEGALTRVHDLLALGLGPQRVAFLAPHAFCFSDSNSKQNPLYTLAGPTLHHQLEDLKNPPVPISKSDKRKKQKEKDFKFKNLSKIEKISEILPDVENFEIGQTPPECTMSNSG